MNKLVISSIVVLAIGCAMLYTVVFKAETNDVDTSPYVLPEDSIESLLVNGETMVLLGQSGPVEINNIKLLPDTISMGSGMYAIGATDGISSRGFSVMYDETNAAIAINLEQEPLSETRQSAEQYLLDIMSISKEELCTLNVLVGVPIDLNAFYGNQNLGISFCPGSIPL